MFITRSFIKVNLPRMSNLQMSKDKSTKIYSLKWKYSDEVPVLKTVVSTKQKCHSKGPLPEGQRRGKRGILKQLRGTGEPLCKIS